MEYENYCIGDRELPYKFIFVTGACRSGKTTFSRIMGSMKNVEWIEEPYELSLLLKSIQLADIDDVQSNYWRKELFQGICKELVNSTVLLRNGNFRPEDLSSIWRYKEGEEIFQRLVNICTRNQVQDFIRKNNSYFVIDIPGILGSASFIKYVCESIKIIHVVRNPYDVAEAIYQKHWYSDERVQHPESNNIFRKYCENEIVYYVPWWCEEGREQDFILATEYERGILYWIYTVGGGYKQL